MADLKRALFDEYKGFADKRVKRLENASTFQVDDRDRGVIGADRKPLSWFCEIHADVLSEDSLRVRLTNAPLNDRVMTWAKENHAIVETEIYPKLTLTLEHGQQDRLMELASVIRKIVAKGARYDRPGYKYACPRVANSLERLKIVLDGVWTPGSKRARSSGNASLF